MKENKPFTFEDIFKQNENRIYYHMHRLGIRDADGEFYAEGLYAMWLAYKRYEPDKGPMSTYFNHIIRYRLIDLMRKKIQEKEKEQDFLDIEKSSLTDGNQSSASTAPLPPISEIPVTDVKYWEDVLSSLTVNQRKWVYYAVIRDWSLQEIAEQEGVTVDAVKSWARQARKKLRKVLGNTGDS